MGHKRLQADPVTGKARLWVDMDVREAYAEITSHLDAIDPNWTDHLRVPPPPWGVVPPS